jgi:hypothetical protein
LLERPEISGVTKLSAIAIPAQTLASVFCPTIISKTARIRNAIAMRLRVARGNFTGVSTLVGIERVA